MNKESSSSVAVAMNDMVPKDKLFTLVSSAQVTKKIISMLIDCRRLASLRVVSYVQKLIFVNSSVLRQPPYGSDA